ncbi:MAG: PilZ domain-containing protein [Candidatus Omnitrophica bacterium]|nr:PilZ domain-containing protein [Candidatus Omnitrophota bacterium]
MALAFSYQDKEKRTSERKNIYASVRYQLKSSQAFGATSSCDISEGGLRLNFERFVPNNTEFLLQMNLPAMPKIVNALGKVVWANRIPHSDRYQLGLKFIEIEDREKTGVSDYLKNAPENITPRF